MLFDLVSEKNLEKELYSFWWRNRHCKFQVDLYYDAEDKKFFDFYNVGGNSWMSGDNMIFVYSVNNEYTDYKELGGVRVAAECFKDSIPAIIQQIKEDKEREVYDYE